MSGGLKSIWLKTKLAVVRQGVPPQDADDLVQEAFLRLGRYEQDHEVHSREAFVMRAAANLIVDRSRRMAVSPVGAGNELDLSAIAATDPLPDEQAESQARLDHLKEGLAALPEPVRRVLLMRRIDGMSFREIAIAENLSVNAVEKRVARATLSLMIWMDQW